MGGEDIVFRRGFAVASGHPCRCYSEAHPGLGFLHHGVYGGHGFVDVVPAQLAVSVGGLVGLTRETVGIEIVVKHQPVNVVAADDVAAHFNNMLHGRFVGRVEHRRRFA